MKVSTYIKKHRSKMVQGLCLSIILLTVFFDAYQYKKVYKRNSELAVELEQLQNVVAIYKEELFKTENRNFAIADALHTEKENNKLFEDQIRTISGTVGVLEKLSKTDSELLKKYSKVYFLNENYIPPKLAQIDQKYLNVKNKPMEIHAEVYPHLQRMLDDAEREGVKIEILSAYRSFGTQANLKSNYKVVYGAGANKFSADQGYSEHQLGTTLDFTTPAGGAVLNGFDKTTAYKWLTGNAYKYGFIISYPKENSYYIFEPWHFRFVGISLATKLHNENTYFYALDQRNIDEYLINLFDN